jgi:hypothetical protein
LSANTGSGLFRQTVIHAFRSVVADSGANTGIIVSLDPLVEYKWRARFLARRLDGLSDEPRLGVPRSISDAKVEEVVVRTLEEVPEGATP